LSVKLQALYLNVFHAITSKMGKLVWWAEINPRPRAL